MPAHAFGENAARQAAAIWGFGPDAGLDLLCVSENATYRLTDPVTGQRSALRLNRPGYHSRVALASELAWTAALRQEAVVPTPRAIPTPGGDAVAVLAPGRYAVMFAFVEGAEPAPGTLAASMPTIGGLAARLHEHARRWARPADFERFAWDVPAAIGTAAAPGRWGDWRAATPAALRTPISAAARRVRSTLDTYGYEPHRFGLIHADLRAANLLVSAHEEGGGAINVIDFDDCGMGWYAYDLAASLSFLEHVPEVDDLAAGWLAGYREVTEFGAAECAAVPSLVMLRRLQLLAWSGSHAETEMVRSLGPHFAAETAEVAAAYLAGRLLADLG